MSEQPSSRRTVLDFCKHYGIKRHAYLTARSKAGVRAKAWDARLSPKDEAALLRYLSVEKRSEQVAQRFRKGPAVTKQFAPPPPVPEIDYAVEINRISDSLGKWRKTLEEFADGHATDDRTGRCKRCCEESPCRTRQVLNRLDNELVEQVAIADSGDPADGFDAADQPASEAQSELTLSQLYEARNRWRRALTELTIDHMIEDGKDRCAHCPPNVSCDVRKVVARINRGIARQIEKYACMGDDEREVALGNRPAARYYEDDGWDAM